MSAANSSATASVVGIDVATDNCYVAVARQGGIEILLNSYSQRSTPACVSFGDKCRLMGVAAKQKQVMNMSNTIYNLTRLIGRKYSDVVQTEVTSWGDQLPFNMSQGPNDEVIITVWHGGEERQFTATQLLAMFLSHLKVVAENATDCVINCPVYYTDTQRRALIDAAKIAGLNPLRMIPDMTAVGVNYAFYRLTGPSVPDQTIVSFLDVGASHTQCSVILFNNKDNIMKILSVEYDSNVGGKHFDETLASYFMNQHKMQLNKRQKLRLLAECEKLKKQMSANSNELPIGIECLQDEIDFNGRMDRNLFEQLSCNLLERIEAVLRRALDFAVASYQGYIQDRNRKAGKEIKFPPFKIDSVEVVGGSSRVPSIKRLVKNVFGLDASTVLNADEAVARGAALTCAMICPTFRVAKELSISDFAPYQIDCKNWSSCSPQDLDVITGIYARGSPMPLTRKIISTVKSFPMNFLFEYLDDKGSVVEFAKFDVSPLKGAKIPQVDQNKIEVRVRLDENGLINLTRAWLYVDCVEEVKEDPPKDQAQPMDVDAQSQQSTEEPMNEDSKDQSAPNEEEKPRTKIVTKAIELQITSVNILGQLPLPELHRQTELELAYIQEDRSWKERMDARNSLEEYVYEWRDKIETGNMDKFVTPADKDSFLASLGDCEKWLYQEEEAEEEIKEKSVYLERLKQMRERYSDGISFRLSESERRGTFLEQAGSKCQLGSKILESPDSARYISPESLEKLKNELAIIQGCVQNAYNQLSTAPLDQNPSVTCAQIEAKTNELDSVIRPVLQEKQRKMDEEKRKLEEEKKKQEEAKKAKASDVKGKGDEKKDTDSTQPSVNGNGTADIAMDTIETENCAPQADIAPTI